MTTSGPAPPRAAIRLLEACLPEGLLGSTILGDLRQEYDELRAAGALRHPRLWYWRTALALSARYLAAGLRGRVARAFHPHTRGEHMAALWADVRYGLRMMARTPLLSAVAVLTVALGVGLTTHTFSTVYGSVLRGLPVPDAERLYAVVASRPDLGFEDMEPFASEFVDLREGLGAFEDLAAFYQGTVNLAGEEAPPERFAGAFVSDNTLDLLGVPPLLGRTFRPGEDRAGATPVMVIGHHVWQNRFGGDPAAVGTTVRANGHATEIVGVMPPGFRFPFLEDVWLPYRLDILGGARDAASLDVFGRLRPDVSPEAALAEVEAAAARFSADYPVTSENRTLYLRPYEHGYMPPEITAVLWVMLAATFGVLLIACANVANLLMARASIRSREIAVRTAMGASRGRLVRQLLLESLLIAALGGALGLALAWAGVGAFNAAIADIYKPYWIDIRLDGPTLAFTLAVTAAASLAAGALPALRASGAGIGEILKDETRGSSGIRIGRLSGALVVSEVAVSCALLIAAGFMVRSVVNLGNVDLGFEAEGVVVGRVGLFETDYPDADARDRFFDLLEERLEVEPGVGSATLTSSLPGLGSSRYFLSIEGETYASDSDYPIVSAASISTDFFETFGVELVAGRSFDALETHVGGAPVAVVNESFAESYLAGREVLGSRVRLGGAGSEWPWMSVVGVVPDMHVGGGVGGIGDDRLRPERLFIPKGFLDHSFYSIAARVAGPPEAFAPRLRELVRELDPNLPVYDVAAFDRALSEATWAFGLFGTLFTIFGAAALFLAGVGLYGVMAFSVAQRRREVGVRMALGARGAWILGMVLRRGLVQLGTGLVIGVALGFALTQPMAVILYGVTTNDPLVYGAIVATLAATGLAATLLPARAATRTDPVEAMRV